MATKNAFILSTGILLFLTLPAISFAVNNCQISTTSPPIPRNSTCERAGSVNLQFDSFTLLQDGDWLYFDMALGVTLCSDIYYETTATDPFGDSISTNGGVYFRITGTSGSTRVWIHVIGVNPGGTLQAGMYGTLGLSLFSAEPNTLNINVSGYSGDYVWTSWDSLNDFLTFVGDMQIAHIIAAAPTVATGLATSVTSDSATLNGTINPNGESTPYYFEYGTTMSYGRTTANMSAGSGISELPVNTSISGLESNTTYHFRIVASNSAGTTNGHDNSFTTLSNPPVKPTLSSPADGTVDVSLTPVLQTGSFSDPDNGDIHLKTEWQASTESDFSSTVVDTTSSSQLTSLTVPQFVLIEGVTYYWRVRFYDNHAVPSAWSDVYSFTTQKAILPIDPPYKPTLSLPADGTVDVSLTPVHQTGSFSDSDNGDIHLKTEWQASTESDFSSLRLYITSSVHLTSLKIPHLVLNEGTTYYWRVRFYDNHLNASQWSDVFSFTTLTTINDQNGNGIPDSQENVTVDLDNDGTPDIEQAHIKSLNTVVGDGQMGVSRRDEPNVTSIEAIESIDPETISDVARPYSMQLGLFAMRLTVANAGDTAEVTVYFSEAAQIDEQWYMYDTINGWVEYSDHALFSADRKSVTLELKDGDYGDADGVANGVIVDPGGFGLASWIEGLVYDSSTNQGILQAQVAISDLALSTALDGYYLSMILPGAYTLAVSASGYDPVTYDNVVVPEGLTLTEDVALSSSAAIPGEMVTSDLWIRAVINTVEKGPIEAVWQKGGEDTTFRGDRVIWGHFYASPDDVTWGSSNNPDLFVKIWFDVSGRIDVNYFHVSVPDIEVYSEYPYDGTVDEHGTTTMSRRYIRQYYENSQSYSEENYEDGAPPAGYSPTGNPSGYSTINDLRIGSIINTVEKGPIDAIWRLGGQDTTSRGDQVVWGHFYASPSDVTWGSQDNPDLFVKIWFDVSGRVDVNFFHVSVPDIEIYSDIPNDSTYDQKGATIMDNRYIRHEYWR